MSQPKKAAKYAFNRHYTGEELPYEEVCALAMIGAGLIKKHRGDPKAINKLLALAVPIDGLHYNYMVKTLSGLCEEACEKPLYDEDAGRETLMKEYEERKGQNANFMAQVEQAVQNMNKDRDGTR